MSPAAPQTVADTFGWDTVFAMNITDVNAAIVKAKSSPKTFTQDIPPGCTVTGTFGDWQICMGGDGKLIHLAVPISTGTFSLGTAATPFANLTAIIEVQLKYFENTSTVPKPGETGVFHDLKINHEKGTDKDGKDTDPVQVIAVNAAGGGDMDFMVKATVPPALTTWLNAHLEYFDHIFATVNLNRVADTGAFQWLYPTVSDYSYQDRSTLDDSILAVLCMTGGRPFDKLVPELTTNAIPSGGRAGFLINKARFLEEMVLPNMVHAFPGCAISDFALAADENSLNLVNEFTMASQTSGSEYVTHVTNVTITIVGKNVVMHSETHTEISPGLTSYNSSDHTYTIKLVVTPSGKQTLGFEEVGTPVESNWTEKSEAFVILQWMEIAVGALATCVLGIMTAGVGFVVGAIIIGALVGLATQVPNLISTIGTDDAHDLSLLSFNTTDPISWDDTANFSLTSATLNESLQLGGVYSST